MAPPVSDRGPPSPAEVLRIRAALITEQDRLLHAGDPAAAEAIGLAIDYWQTVHAQTPVHPQTLPDARPAPQ